MNEPIWSGQLGGVERQYERATGEGPLLTAPEVQTLCAEIVGTQKGVSVTYQGLQDLTRQLGDLRDRVSADDRAMLQGIIDGLGSLASAVASNGAAVKGLLERLADPKTPDFDPLTRALAVSSDKTAGAVENLCTTLAERDREYRELVMEFGDVSRLRYWALNGMRMRRFFGQVYKVPEDQLASWDGALPAPDGQTPAG